MRGSKAKVLRRALTAGGGARSKGWTREIAAVCSILGTMSPGSLWALPQDGKVAAGSATISSPTSTSMRIDQVSDRVVIDWARFNIAGNESVRFQQPSAASIALNRVAGFEASGIFGSLSANGQIIISNPSGILFSPSSRVDVGALTATTLNITNKDFLEGQYHFAQDSAHANAAVVNQGVITAGPGGYVALLGAAVSNEGVIQAQLGTVALGAAKAATLDMRGDGKIGFVVTDSVSGTVAGPNGEHLSSYVSNTGTLRADGGTVILSARAATDVIKSVVNHEGIIEARSLEERNGQIFLNGGDVGIVSVSGTVDASGAEKGQTGGTVQVVGDKVGLFGAHINVVGDAGGGLVQIGGDLHGKPVVSAVDGTTTRNASRTFVSADSTINADALASGDGGKVIVWADDITRYAGHISAHGGAQTGNGGFVEVSGKNLLQFEGGVDLNAAHGTAGTLLLDPLNATFSTAADSNTTGFTAGTDNTEAFSDDAGLSSVFNVNAGGSFAGVGNGATITVEATNNITISNNFILATATGNSDVSLVLRAGNNIAVNANVAATGLGTVTLAADQGFAGFPSNGAGAITRLAAGNTISQANGTLTLSSATGITATTAVGSLSATNTTSGNITITNTGTLNVANLSETGGNTSLTNTGALTLGAINQTGGTLTTSATGSLNLNGNITSTGNVSFTSVGVTQAGGSTVNAGGSTILVDANDGAIDMNGTLQTTNNTTSAITLRDATTAALGTLTATAGRVVLGSAAGNNLSGAITQNPGTVINANSLSITGGNTIALDNANQIDTLSTVTRGGAFSLTDTTGGLIVTGPITAGTTTNSVSLVTAGGALAINGAITANQISLAGTGVTQIAGATVNADGGTILIDANDGAITMAGTLTTTNGSSTAVRLIDSTTATLGNITATTGTVVLGEAGDDNLSGAVIQTAGTTLNAGTITATTGNSISLTRTTNRIGALGSIDRGGALTVVDSAGGLIVNGPITGGTITNAVSLTTAGSAPLAINGNISTSGANDVSLIGVGVTHGAGATVNADAGNVTVDAGTGQFAMAAGSSIQTAGNVTVSANTINLAGLIQATGPASEVKLAPDTVATAINLGAGAAAGFALTDAELNTIEAPIVRIGSVAGAPFGGATSGAITLTGNFASDAQFATNLLELRTTGAVTATAGALDLGLSNSNLALRAGGVVNIGTANHNLNGVAATTTNTNSAITLRDGINGMTIATVDGLNGLATANGAVTVSAAGPLALNADVIKSGSTNLSLTGTGITQDPGTTVNAGSGTITVDANDGVINLNGTLITTNATATAVRILDASTAALGNITATAGTAVLGAAAPAGDNLSGAVTQNPGTVVNVTSLSINGGDSVTLDNANQIANIQAVGTGGAISVTDTTGNLTVTGVTNPGGSLKLSTPGNLIISGSLSSGTVRLLSGNNISRSGFVIVSATDLLLDAVNGIGTASLGILTNVPGQLAARITGPAATGDIFISDTGSGGSLTIGSVGGVSGISTTNNRSIQLDTFVRSIVLAADVAASGAGNVSLNSTSSPMVGQGGRVSTGSGVVTLRGLGVGTTGTPVLTDLGTGTLVVSTVGTGSNGDIAISNNTPGGLNTSQVTTLSTDVSVNSILLQQTAGDITVGGSLNIPSDNLTLAATTGDILAGAGRITSGSGTLTLTGAKVGSAVAPILTNLGTGSLSVTTTGAGAAGDIGISNNSAGGLNTAQVAALNTGATVNSILLRQTVGGMTVGSPLVVGNDQLTMQTTAAGGTITLNAKVSASGGGDSITLASGGNFQNNVVGADALDPGPGRWLVYSTNPASDTRGDLVFNFKQYNTAYPTAPNALATGNGFLYTIAPTVTASLTGLVTKVYDGTNTATLTAGNYAVNGAIDGDTVTLNNPSLGTYNNKNVGTNKNVSVSNLSIDSATNGAATVFGYQLASTTANANIGEITARPLTLTAVTNTKTYDATTSAAATPTVTGLQGADTVTGLAEAYADKNAGINKTLAVSAFTVNDGNGGNNYSISTVDNTTGVINQAPLTLTAVTNSKTYDGTTSAAATPTVAGLQGADTVTGLAETYADKNVGTNKTLAISTFTVVDGNNGNNYTPNLVTDTTGVITARPLTVTAQTDTKVYDSTTSSNVAPLITTGSLVGGDTSGFLQTFDTQNVGIGKTLTAGGAVSDGNNGGNYTVNFVTNGTGIITTRPLTVTANDQNKIFGTTFIFTGNEFTPTGLQGGETIGSVTLASPGSPAAAPVAGSPYPITASAPTGGTFAASNYSISFADGALTVSPPGATVAAAPTLETTNLDTSVLQTGILESLTAKPLGPPTLLSSGILPETFFQTLGCENFERDVCPSAEEGEEEPTNVVIVGP